MLNQLAKRANELGVGLAQAGVSATSLAEIVRLRGAGEIGPQAIEPLLELASDSDETPTTLAEANGLLVVRDEGAMEGWIDEAIAAHPQAAEDVAAGKDAAIGRLLGHVMKLSQGQADAKEVRSRFLSKLRI